MLLQYFDKVLKLGTILDQFGVLVVQSTAANQAPGQVVLTVLLYLLCSPSEWYISMLEPSRK